MTHREDTIRALAADATSGPWEAYFTAHGDPHVVEAGRGPFGAITGGTVSTAPDDYGRANCRFIAAADPETVAAMADVIAAARSVAGHLDNPHYSGHLRAALAVFDGADSGG